jgi:hypothetical protein
LTGRAAYFFDLFDIAVKKRVFARTDAAFAEQTAFIRGNSRNSRTASRLKNYALNYAYLP